MFSLPKKPKEPESELKFDSRKSPDGAFDWIFINTKVTDLRLPLSIIDGEKAITFKIDTTCPAVLEKNVKGVLTFLSEKEVNKLYKPKLAISTEDATSQATHPLGRFILYASSY